MPLTIRKNGFKYRNPDGTYTGVDAVGEGSVTEAVNNWLDNHPEATTTVQDGSITMAKLAPAVAENVATVPDLKSVLIDGKISLDKTDERNAYPSKTIGQPVSFNPSSATSTYNKIIRVFANMSYTISVTNGSTPASENARDSVIIDASDIVRQVFAIPTTASATNVATFTSSIDGWLVLAVDKNYTNIAIVGHKDYVTPEMFGAVGDGSTDDITAIEDCLNSNCSRFVFSKTYYISRPITNVKNDALIEGNGSIVAESAGFLIDGKRGWAIRDLKIYFKTYGFHITSTSSYVQYGNVENVTLTGNDSDSIGVYIERTTSHLNEIRFTNVICWGVKKGFFINNPDTNASCGAHRFLFCSAENATECGFELTNADSISLIFSRIAETNGFKIKSSGICNDFVIISDYFIFQDEQQLSDNTNGVAFGCFRSGEIFVNTFGGYARIVNGKIIPCDSLLTDAFNTDTLNSDASFPIINNTKVYTRNSWTKYGTSTSTLTLDARYYGGRGLINDLYIVMGGGAGAITVVNGDYNFTIPSPADIKTYHLKFLNVGGNRRWRYEEMMSFI